MSPGSSFDQSAVAAVTLSVVSVHVGPPGTEPPAANTGVLIRTGAAHATPAPTLTRVRSWRRDRPGRARSAISSFIFVSPCRDNPPIANSPGSYDSRIYGHCVSFSHAGAGFGGDVPTESPPCAGDCGSGRLVPAMLGGDRPPGAGPFPLSPPATTGEEHGPGSPCRPARH